VGGLVVLQRVSHVLIAWINVRVTLGGKMNLLIQTVNVLRIATGSATVLTCLKSILAISVLFLFLDVHRK